MKTGKIDAIIPARGGSKGLPRKNLLPLAGMPLIAHTIRAALHCPGISRCVVSTEDEEIKTVSLEWGAEVLDRPRELAGDLSLSRDVVRQVVLTLHARGELPDYFALLQPTSPFRTAGHLQACLRAFLNSDFASAVSVTEAEHHPYKMFTRESGALVPLMDQKWLDAPRQILPPIYRPNGAIYLVSSSMFLDRNSFFVDPIMPFIMKSEDSWDIDTAWDLKIAELLKSGS